VPEVAAAADAAAAVAADAAVVARNREPMMTTTRFETNDLSPAVRASRVVLAMACALALAMPVADALAQGAKKKEAAAKNLPAQASYPSADAAAKALYDAVKSDDLKAIYAVLGPGSGPLIASGDRVADDAVRNDFVAAYDKASKVDAAGDKATLLVGPNQTPFPFPLVKNASGWQFDAKAGAEEIVNRRIGENEISAMKVCLAYVDAQREYVLRDADKNGVLEYAQKLMSSPGKQDGLYWPTQAGEPQSPLGPFAAQARAEGYGKASKGAKSAKGRGPGGYHGYRYRILTAQGKDAKGGAYDYIVNGRMIGGFAMVAFPVRYGVSGVMSFVCSHEGVVYEKDLGANTQEVASSMRLYNPDRTWKKADAS
jgi:hypothetical protein